MPAPQGAPMPPQGGPPPGPSGPPQPSEGGGAEQVVSQIQDGIQKLKKLVESGDPQLKQAFMGLENSFQAFVEEASEPAEGGAPPPPEAPGPKGGVIPANAGKGSSPSQYGGA